jgi:hypothetical protein
MVVSISWEGIIDRIFQAEKEIVFVMPAIHEEWADAIMTRQKDRPIRIKACIANSEEDIRKGYGSIKAIEILKEAGAEIVQADGIKVNVLAFDGYGFAVFLESRILTGNPEGFNAIELDKIATGNIAASFFNNSLAAENSNLNVPILSIPLDEAKIEEVKKNLQVNPPAEPDLQRKITTYTTHFQYAELHFEGANIHNTKVTIPPSALPFKNDELKKRMKTRFDLFSKEQTETWAQFLNLKKEIDKVRTDYLVPCSLKRDRSILRKAEKQEFQQEIEKLKASAINKTELLYEIIQKAIFNSSDILKSELTTFLTNNPPKELDRYSDPDVRKRMIERMVEEVLFKTKLPNANELLNKISLKVDYAEMTVEDLDNKEFLDWFLKKGLIDESNRNEIANFHEAYKTKL